MKAAAHSPQSKTSPQRLLAWTFRRGGHFLTCELLSTSPSEFALLVTPHWTGGTAIVEQMTNGVSAFHRHAAIALQLRQQGWTVVAYAAVPSPHAPKPESHRLAA
jgi:hypothetical protein